jgi:hypothetical protein
MTWSEFEDPLSVKANPTKEVGKQLVDSGSATARVADAWFPGPSRKRNLVVVS